MKYEMIRNIYQYMGFGEFFRTDLNRVNILGIRAFNDPDNTPNIYNDLISVAWLDSDSNPQCEDFMASTDPGRIDRQNAVNPQGVAYLMDGYLYWYYLSRRIATYFDRDSGRYLKTEYRCMRNSSAEQKVWRDSNFDGSIDDVEYTHPMTGSGILIHYGGENMERVGSWSQGCQIIPSIDAYERFIQLMNMNKSSILGVTTKEVPYLLCDVRKLPENLFEDSNA